MIDPKEFYNSLRKNEIDFFAGVPDSLLKEFCAYLDDHAEEGEHIICANEGNAIAMAAGYHLASGGVPLVYMQNSGLGNATNPLLSLADREVYGIPMILMIGWRRGSRESGTSRSMLSRVGFSLHCSKLWRFLMRYWACKVLTMQSLSWA